MRRVLRENGLSLVMFGIFLLMMLGMSLAGWRSYNEDQQEHRESAASYTKYLTTAHFGEATFENWESEFLQMGAYVLLTALLYQKGSPESRKLDEENPEDEDPGPARGRPDAPWAVRHGGAVSKVYEHSLTLALFGLFFLSIVLHAITGAREYSQTQMEHGEQAVSTLQFVTTSRFWFESLQNWQSEFFSIGMLLVLQIFLRQRRSTESKPVAAPHGETGSA
jgi:preprotein translocase subunit SecG